MSCFAEVCDEDKFYSDCFNQTMCDDLTNTTFRTSECVKGCQCKDESKVMINKTCVDREECKLCLYNGKYYKVIKFKKMFIFVGTTVDIHEDIKYHIIKVQKDVHICWYYC